MPTAAKVELVERALAAGVRRVEAVSFARPDRVPTMADAEEVMASVSRPPGSAWRAWSSTGGAWSAPWPPASTTSRWWWW